MILYEIIYIYIHIFVCVYIYIICEYILLYIRIPIHTNILWIRICLCIFHYQRVYPLINKHEWRFVMSLSSPRVPVVISWLLHPFTYGGWVFRGSGLPQFFPNQQITSQGSVLTKTVWGCRDWPTDPTDWTSSCGARPKPSTAPELEQRTHPKIAAEWWFGIHHMISVKIWVKIEYTNNIQRIRWLEKML